MVAAKKKHPYYNYMKLFSFNAVWMFLCGGRGLGKTYGAKIKAIKANIRTGEQFIYLRRYKTELVSRETFFADIDPSVFPNWDFRVVGRVAQRAHTKSRGEQKREWITMGYFMSLSTAQSQKSVAFPRVTLIIFDEFILEKSSLQYLPDEAKLFANFYNTVDRYQDKTRVLFLANAVSINNPYFIEYRIVPDKGDEFVSKDNGFILCHFPNSDDFQSSVYETRFGRFIRDTEYAEYAVGNTFEDNNESLIAPKDSSARYMFTLETKGGKFSVWFDVFSNQYYIQEKLPKAQTIFTLLADKMDENKRLLVFSDRPLQQLRSSFRSGNVSFDKPPTRNAFVDVFKR